MDDTADAIGNEEKRQRCLSRKALQNEIDQKRKELDKDVLILQNAFENALKLSKNEQEDLLVLQNATEKYK